jgi:hypothetical protein
VRTKLAAALCRKRRHGLAWKQRKDQTGQDQKLARSDFLHLDPAGKLVKSFATREQQDAATVVPTATQLAAPSNCPEQKGER